MTNIDTHSLIFYSFKNKWFIPFYTTLFIKIFLSTSNLFIYLLVFVEVTQLYKNIIYVAVYKRIPVALGDVDTTLSEA